MRCRVEMAQQISMPATRMASVVTSVVTPATPPNHNRAQMALSFSGPTTNAVMGTMPGAGSDTQKRPWNLKLDLRLEIRAIHLTSGRGEADAGQGWIAVDRSVSSFDVKLTTPWSPSNLTNFRGNRYHTPPGDGGRSQTRTK